MLMSVLTYVVSSTIGMAIVALLQHAYVPGMFVRGWWVYLLGIAVLVVRHRQARPQP